jgi:hypothetical protein
MLARVLINFMQTRTKATKRKRKLSTKNMVFIDHFPEENKEGSIECITDALFHIGIFEGIKK